MAYVSCDRCPARAAHCWTRTTLALWFCRHHSRTSETRLTGDGWTCELLDHPAVALR